MRLLQDLSIRRKLMLVIILTSSLGLILAGIVIVGYEWGVYRQRVTVNLSTLAQVIGGEESAALIFNDPKAGRQTLAALKGKPAIEAAAIYDAKGKAFVAYPGRKLTGAPDFNDLPPNGYRFIPGFVELSQSILQDGEVVGTIYVRQSLAEMNSQFAHLIGIVALIDLGMLVLVMVFSVAFQRAIADPIVELAAVARHVATSEDYSVRVKGSGRDEIGQLLQMFNAMLEQIEASHVALSASNAALQTEITERQRVAEVLRESEYRLRQVMQRARCILWSGEVKALPGWEEHTGDPAFFSWQLVIPAEEASQAVMPLQLRPGQTYSEAFLEYRFQESGSRRLARSQALFALTEDVDHYSLEFRCGDKNEESRWLNEDVSVHAEAPGVWRLVGVVTDITDRKRANEQLEDYAGKLERSNQELQDFAYVSSHDLQEPLRAIQNFSERLRTKYAQELPPEGLDYLARMERAAGRMRVLIQDLLSYSRVTTKAKPFEATSLGAVAQAVVADLTGRIEETGGKISFELGALPALQADATQMRQLLQNLIGNALKYHKSDVPPIVEVRGEFNASTDSVIITVQDNGIGFDEKYADRIFAPFQRLHGQGKYEGTGIGLAICRKIVERHNGKIEVMSKPDEGARFSVLLPVHR